ncbi:MAG: flagellar hook protein FlgE [Bacteroidota bacterium]
MIRSLGNGVSGLNNHQIKMDVVGNNIANVNTIAFKKGRVTFNEVLAQEYLASGRTPGGEPTNPSFVGLGIHVGTIDQTWTQGPLESTNIPTDFAINGDGFFVARRGAEFLLSRAGNFVLSKNGNLISSSGLPIQGFPIDQTTGQADLTQLDDISIDLNAKASPVYTSAMTVSGNLDAALSDNGGVNPETFAMTSFVYDEQGAKHNVTYTFTKTSADGATPDTYDVSVAGDATLQPFGAAPTTFSIAFGTDGNLESVDGVAVTDPAFNLPALNWDTGFVNETGTDTISIDLTGLTQFRENSSAIVSDQNGKPSGQFVGFRTTNEGVIQMDFDSGHTVDVYQIAIGKVANNGGLTQKGENVYSATSVSGSIQFGRAGSEIASAIISGTLEMSNVELATEFSDMIKTQRGFQASARVIRTSDEILSETINLKR